MDGWRVHVFKVGPYMMGSVGHHSLDSRSVLIHIKPSMIFLSRHPQKHCRLGQTGSLLKQCAIIVKTKSRSTTRQMEVVRELDSCCFTCILCLIFLRKINFQRRQPCSKMLPSAGPITIRHLIILGPQMTTSMTPSPTCHCHALPPLPLRSRLQLQRPILLLQSHRLSLRLRMSSVQHHHLLRLRPLPLMPPWKLLP